MNWDELFQEVEKDSRGKQVGESKEESELSVAAHLLKGADSVLSHAIADNLSKVAPEGIGRKIEQLRRKILLTGPEYNQAIQECAVIANEDYKYAENSLKHTYSTLKNLAKNIHNTTEVIQNNKSNNGQANTAKEVAKQLATTRDYLKIETLKELEGVRGSLRAKQRALNH